MFVAQRCGLYLLFRAYEHWFSVRMRFSIELCIYMFCMGVKLHLHNEEIHNFSNVAVSLDLPIVRYSKTETLRFGSKLCCRLQVDCFNAERQILRLNII